jgi:hypothetical protein
VIQPSWIGPVIKFTRSGVFLRRNRVENRRRVMGAVNLFFMPVLIFANYKKAVEHEVFCV